MKNYQSMSLLAAVAAAAGGKALDSERMAFQKMFEQASEEAFNND